MKLIRTHLFIFLAVLVLFACKKDEGRGGQATITGKVYAYDVNRNGIRVDSGYMAGVRVYISYGNSNVVDDDTRTSFDGTYSFQWLNKGDIKRLSDQHCITTRQARNIIKGKSRNYSFIDKLVTEAENNMRLAQRTNQLRQNLTLINS